LDKFASIEGGIKQDGFKFHVGLPECYLVPTSGLFLAWIAQQLITTTSAGD
jgi:hypothetical protein